MIYVVTTLHIIVCLFLIGVVLLQTGKRADLAGAFGGGGSQTAFGTRGAATFLTKLTTSFAVLFMLTTITLSVISFRASHSGGESVLDELPAAAGVPAETGGDVPTPGDDLTLDPALESTDADGEDTGEQPADPVEDSPSDESEEP